MVQCNVLKQLKQKPGWDLKYRFYGTKTEYEQIKFGQLWSSMFQSSECSISLIIRRLTAKFSPDCAKLEERKKFDTKMQLELENSN